MCISLRLEIRGVKKEGMKCNTDEIMLNKKKKFENCCLNFALAVLS